MAGNELSQGLKESGFVDGENVVILYSWADGQIDRLPKLASELVRRRVAVIIAAGDATRQLHRSRRNRGPSLAASMTGTSATLRLSRRLKHTRHIPAFAALVCNQTRLVEHRRDAHDLHHRCLAARARREIITFRSLLS
jgi:hypothetical protein